MNKQNMSYPHNEIQLSNVREQTLWLVKEARCRRLHSAWFHVSEMSRKGKFVESESTSVASWDLGVGAEIKCKQAGRNFLADGNVLVKVSHLVKFAKNRWIVYLKWVNCMPCKLLINKAGVFFVLFCFELQLLGEERGIRQLQAPKSSEHAAGLHQFASTRWAYYLSY